MCAHAAKCVGAVSLISGKSYTMGTDTLYASTDDTDVDRRLGIIPRAVRQIFQELEAKVRDSGRRLKVDTTNSYVEIYSESSAPVRHTLIRADRTRPQMRTSSICWLATWT